LGRACAGPLELDGKACTLNHTTPVAGGAGDEPAASESIALLSALSEAVCRSRAAEDVFDLALDTLRRVLGADRASVLLCDAADCMRFKAWRGLSDAYRAAVEGHSPWPQGEGAVPPEPILVSDVESDPSLDSVRSIVLGEGIRALAFIPLHCRGRLLGKFMVYYDRPHAFSDREVGLAQIVASQVAVAAERRVFEQERASLLAREQHARTQAEAANRMKDEFLATLSHELRTPLNAMLGWTRLLRTGQLDQATTGRALETIERNALAQAQLVEDLLDVSRIITGKLRLDVQPVHLEHILETSIDAVRPAADARGITIETDIDSESRVLGDGDRLRQIVWNLLSNAIKFTPSGGWVRVALKRVDPHLQVTVADSGAGIAPEFLPYVFERFRQSDGNSTRVHGGLGLGLAIVRHLVELHGGSVHADSAGDGQGATFTVKLPIAAVKLDAGARPGADRPAATDRVLAGIRVLVVDDEPDARDLLASVLCPHGAEVSMASSAAQARQLFERVRPHVLVSDIGMPGEDGYSLIRRIRAIEERRGRRTPAVALTAFARSEDRSRALLAGFQLHVPKPVEPDEFVIAVAILAGRIEAARQLQQRRGIVPV
jgi:signal transduction histidine kinase/AmiR/NasT family two-component response regulator